MDKPAPKRSARPETASKHGRGTGYSQNSSQEAIEDGEDENIDVENIENDDGVEETNPKLSFDDVKELALEVRMRFQREGLPIEDFENLVVGRTHGL